MDDFGQFRPSCVICRNPVPEKRSHGRYRETCSPECLTTWRRFRAYIIASTRCPSCYHPSTPDEREDFRKWRRFRGELHSKSGRPAATVAQKLRRLVATVIPELQKTDIDRLVSLADDLQKLLDQEPNP